MVDPPELETPVDTALHPDPSHWARPVAETPPADVKLPPITRFPPNEHRVYTSAFAPVPRARHCAPSQRATRLSVTALLVRKLPAAYRVPPWTHSALTSPPTKPAPG